MMHMPAPDELVAIEGPDAIAFAHAQFSSDVRSLAPGCWHWSAWLNARGRVQNFFALLRTEPTHLMLWLPLGGAYVMAQGLQRFKIRAKLEIRVLDGWGSRSVPLAGIDPISERYAVRRLGKGYALVLPGSSLCMTTLAPIHAEVQAPRAAVIGDVFAGLPFLSPSLAGELLPQALDLERLGAIRFDKGCYPGQEIAARLHFRGGDKSLLYRLALPACTEPPEPGTPVMHEDQPVGRVLYGVRDADADYVRLLAALPVSLDEATRLVVPPDHEVADLSHEFATPHTA
ncbi:MAG: folate-binding protein [Rhodanobacteraceae bacterium]